MREIVDRVYDYMWAFCQKAELDIDMASRYEVTLAEILNESIIQGSDNSATLCRDIRSRRSSTARVKRRPKLRVV